MKLSNKVAIVTGASSGMGKATALQFAKEGAKGIVVVSRTQSKLEEVAKEIEATGTKAVIVSGNVSEEETNKKMVEAAFSEFGQLDVAFLNAGAFGMKPIVELTSDDIDGLMNANFKSVVWGLKHILLAMAKSTETKGSIIVNSSAMGEMARAGSSGASMYSASKAAVDMLVKYAAIEAAEAGTRVNAVAPGVVATNIIGLDEASSNAFAENIQLVGRAGKSDEIANVVTMLASDDGSFVNGAIITADGGWSLKA